MKTHNNLALVVTVSCLLVFFGLACGHSGTGNAVTEDPNIKNPANVTAADTPEPKTQPDIAGTYDITGTNEGGGDPYSGTLVITKRDAVSQFSWSSGPATYDGVGVQSGDIVAVSFIDGDDGKGCGVVLYDIASNGDLTGKAGFWGMNEGAAEKALKDTGSGLEGRYEVSGTNPDGKTFKSALNVKKEGEGFAFDWSGDSPMKGFGVRMGDRVAVGFGKNECGFLMYQVNANGSLDGKWGTRGSSRLGTETAKKQ